MVLLAILGVCLVVAPMPTTAVAGSAPAGVGLRASEVPTAEQLADKRVSVEEDGSLDPAVRDQILALLDATQRAIDGERAAAQRLLELQQELAGLPAQREAIATDLAQMVDAPVTVAPDATLEQIRAARDEADASLRAAQERRASLDRELVQRAERRAALPVEIAGLEESLDELDQTIAAGPPPDIPAALLSSRTWALAAQRAEVARRIATVRAELALIDARPEMDALRRERAARRISVREGVLRQWQTIVVAAEARRAEEAFATARQAVAEASPAVKAVADRRFELVNRLNNADPEIGVAAANRQLADALSRVDLRLARLARQYEQDRQRVLDIGMAGLASARLHRQRSELPDLSTLRRGRTTLRHELGRVQRELTDLELEREALPSLREQRDAILDPLPPVTDADPEAVREERRALVAELEAQLEQRQKAMDRLIVALRERDDMLLQIQERLIPLKALTREYIAFIDERILWLRSMDAINVRDLGAAWDSAWTHIRPEALGGFAQAALRRFIEAPSAPVLLLLGVSAAAWASMRIRRRRERLAELVARPHTDRIAHTVEATVTAIAWAGIWPGALALAALMIGTVDDPAAVGPRLASGLDTAAWMLLALRLVGELTRRNGLALAHYGWRPESCALLRRHLRWYGPLALALVFVQGSLEFEQAKVGTDPLARLATMTLSASTALLLARLFGPRRGLLVGAMARTKAPWLERLMYVVYPTIVGVPALLVILDAIGFSFTVNQLHFAVFQTALFAIGVLLVAGLVARWLMLTRRRLAMDEARRRLSAATSGDDGQTATADGDLLSIESASLDLVAMDAQTRQLMRTGLAVTVAVGLFLIWSQMLPALGMLGRIELWPRFAQVQEALVAPPALETVIGEQATLRIRRSAVATGGTYVPVFTAAGVPVATPGERMPAADPPPAPSPTAPPAAVPAPPPPPVAPTMTQAAPTVDFASPTTPRAAATDPHAVDQRGRVTVANLLLAILVTILAVLISRNIPGLIEIAVLSRLPMAPSGRYAVTALTRYVIAVVAIFMAFGYLGVGWSQVQWLVAAATVGVGFGLQEIVANFISGVIILFEQPIRVGDTVTVGNVSGTVTKIRMRATTITDWDRKELVIPNKEFITGQVINWTLSDPTLRLVISVGVEYGSDTAKTEQILLECARNHPIVLKDPPPSVVFSRFGASSLDFDLRVFLPSIEHLVRTRHELHNAVDQAFRKAGIVIAFPQQDVHIRDISGTLGVRRTDDGPRPPAGPPSPDRPDRTGIGPEPGDPAGAPGTPDA